MRVLIYVGDQDDSQMFCHFGKRNGARVMTQTSMEPRRLIFVLFVNEHDC